MIRFTTKDGKLVDILGNSVNYTLPEKIGKKGNSDSVIEESWGTTIYFNNGRVTVIENQDQVRKEITEDVIYYSGNSH